MNLGSDQNIEHLTSAALHLEVSHLAFVASLTWFVWDWLLTLSCEIDVIWRRRITLGSFLYLVNALVCIASIGIRVPVHFDINTPINLCPVLFEIATVLQSVQISILQCVLALRTYAVYSCSKLVLVPLLALNATSFALSMGKNVRPIARVIYQVNSLSVPYNGCILPPYYRDWPPCVLLLAFELAVGVLMLARLVKTATRCCSLARVEYIVYRDGLIEFFGLYTTLVIIWS
ncbi:hypothetical protein DL93DRAFT_600906 [Clavulina sp. PMI_390]|nr:hypothetical protein DL93DRAFT_600906 [Clavulina sp. PMI_390]